MARKSRISGVASVILSMVLCGLTGCVGYQGRMGQHGSGGCSSCTDGYVKGPGIGCTTCGHAGLHGLKDAPLMNGEKIQRVKDHFHGVPYQTPNPGPTPYGQACPTELNKFSHPPHKIAPPDILVINAIRLVPRPPYRLEPLETLVVQVTDTLPNQPIAGPFTISLEGTINLGYSYGTVYVGGLTPDQAQAAIRRHLGNTLKSPQVNVALAQFRGMEMINGEHLVRPDGTISLGTYGSVYVAGLSLGQAKCVIEKHLSEYLLNPQISIDVFAYNSRVYYVIVDGGGFGQQIFRLPATGNETVLDAISHVQGLAPVSSKKRIWLARPSPANHGCNQILPIDWRAITEAGSTATNYQLFPGDRIYVSADCLIAFDNYLSKVLAPIERMLGITLLGANTVQTITGQNTLNNGAIILP